MGFGRNINLREKVSSVGGTFLRESLHAGWRCCCVAHAQLGILTSVRRFLAPLMP